MTQSAYHSPATDFASNKHTLHDNNPFNLSTVSEEGFRHSLLALQPCCELTVVSYHNYSLLLDAQFNIRAAIAAPAFGEHNSVRHVGYLLALDQALTPAPFKAKLAAASQVLTRRSRRVLSTVRRMVGTLNSGKGNSKILAHSTHQASTIVPDGLWHTVRLAG